MSADRVETLEMEVEGLKACAALQALLNDFQQERMNLFSREVKHGRWIAMGTAGFMMMMAVIGIFT